MILAEREIESRMLNLAFCKAQVGNCVNDVAKVSKKAADDKHCVMQSFGLGGGGVCLFPSAFFVQGYCLIMIENC